MSEERKELNLGTYMDEPRDLKALVGALCDYLNVKVIEVTEGLCVCYYEIEPTTSAPSGESESRE